MSQPSNETETSIGTPIAVHMRTERAFSEAHMFLRETQAAFPRSFARGLHEISPLSDLDERQRAALFPAQPVHKRGSLPRDIRLWSAHSSPFAGEPCEI